MILSPDVMVGFDSVGSACCVWRDALSTYLLSAAHVFTDVQDGTRIRWLSPDLTASGSGTPLLSRLWLPMPGGELDAGLVQIDDPGPFRVGGLYPKSEQILSWHGIGEGTVVQICGTHGSPVATFARKRPAGDAFKGHTHGRLLQFRFIESFTTSPGDSGAAVISLPEGLLVGMHIVLHRDEQGVPHSLVVPAEDIRDTFGALLPDFGLRP